MSITFTQADLDNLKAAYLSGALRVRIGEREIIYRSQEEILRAIETVQRYLAGATTARPSLIQAKFNKGYSE